MEELRLVAWHSVQVHCLVVVVQVTPERVVNDFKRIPLHRLECCAQLRSLRQRVAAKVKQAGVQTRRRIVEALNGGCIS